MVDKVFELLSGQMPATRKYQRKLVNYFKQLVIVKHVPPVPPFSQDFEHIIIPLQYKIFSLISLIRILDS